MTREAATIQSLGFRPKRKLLSAKRRTKGSQSSPWDPGPKGNYNQQREGQKEAAVNRAISECHQGDV